jgi:hypothetical protein
MDTRLPFKRDRLAIAHHVQGFASKIGLTKLADAIEVGICRIEKELAPRRCKKGAKSRYTEQKATQGSSHERTSGDGGNLHGQAGEEIDGLDYGNDGHIEGQKRGQHSPIPASDKSRPSRSKRLQKELGTEAKGSHRSERRLDPGKENTKRKDKRSDPSPLVQVPKFSFKGVKKGLAFRCRT